MREVAALANPAAPRTVSQRAFDRARVGSAEHAHLPAARQIARELKLPWSGVLAVAHAPANQRGKVLATKTREQMPKGWLTPARIKRALRLVAGRLGVDTLSRIAYDVERGVVLKADARDWLHGRRQRLPSANAISVAAGGWNAALRAAGLKAHAPAPPTIHQVIVTRVEVMDRFHDHYKEQPSHKALEDFARANKIPMSSESGRKWSETVAEWRQSRIDRGLGEPRVVDYRRRRDANGRPMKAPDYGANVGAAKPGEHPYHGKWEDEELCAEWVARYLATLTGGEASTEHGYEAWVRQNPGAPHSSAFRQHGGWDKVRGKATERPDAR